jgi:hypothetical protein
MRSYASASGRAERRGSKRRLPPFAKPCRHARAPLDWAGTQNNFGIALTTLGRREGGTARLEEAVAAFREALQERTRARAAPMGTDPANLAVVYRAFFAKTGKQIHLDDALEAVGGALDEYHNAKSAYYIAGAERLRAELLAMKGNPKNRAAKK